MVYEYKEKEEESRIIILIDLLYWIFPIVVCSINLLQTFFFFVFPFGFVVSFNENAVTPLSYLTSLTN